MKVTRKSLFSGQVNTMDLDVTEEQLARWRAGENIQDVFPNLTADEREFLISGCLPDEWDEMFDDDDYATGKSAMPYRNDGRGWDYD